jgi:hypothetical protein
MNGQFPSAPEINITCAGVLKLLQKLNPNKAAGPDNIRPKILNELAAVKGFREIHDKNICLLP